MPFDQFFKAGLLGLIAAFVFLFGYVGLRNAQEGPQRYYVARQGSQAPSAL